MGPWLAGDLGTPELLILLIVALLIFGGLLVLVTISLATMRRAPHGKAEDQQRSGDGDH
jgi:hypothetical protein